MNDHQKIIRFEDNDDTILLNEATNWMAQPSKEVHNPDDLLTETTNMAASTSPGERLCLQADVSCVPLAGLQLTSSYLTGRSPDRSSKRLSSPLGSKGTSIRKSPREATLRKGKATAPIAPPLPNPANLGKVSFLQEFLRQHSAGLVAVGMSLLILDRLDC